MKRRHSENYSSSKQVNKGRRRGNYRTQSHTAMKNSGRTGTKSMGPVKVFLFTLGCVLLVGSLIIVCITLPRYIRSHQNQRMNILDFVETIPETLTAPESISLSEEESVEDTVKGKYDDQLQDAQYMQDNNIYTQEGRTEGSVTLGFIGDILFDDEYAPVAALIQRGGELSKSIDENTLETMRSMDVMVVNNEFPYTERGSRQQDKQFTFRADYDTAFYLNEMGADVAILANNHVYDYGEVGLLDTLDILNNVGVHPLGAGRNIKEASAPVYYIVNDIKVALIAATQIERLDNPNTIGAGEDSPGVFRCWGSDLIYSVIEEAKQNADFVIVCIHWGTEKQEEPDYWQTLQAPKLAEAGADLIVGDHTHRLQGVYYYGDVPCIYSLGNFWFNGSTIDSGMLEVTINENGLESLKFLPAVQKNYSAYLVGGDEYNRILNYMRSLSPNATISDEGYISKK